MADQGNRLFIRLRFLIVAFIGFLFFDGLYNAGFVTDFLGWMECYDSGTRFFALHACFGVQGIYYIPFACMLALTKLFGYNPTAWYLFFIGFHLFNGWLVFRLIRECTGLWNYDPGRNVAVAGAVLFVFFPYQVEVLAWKACINYLTACCLFLVTVLLFVRYLRTKREMFYALAAVTYVLSFFTVEFFFATPFVLLLLVLTCGEIKRKQSWFSAIILSALIGVYQLISGLVIGKAIGHYEIDIASLHPLSVVSTELKYIFKLLFMGRFWSFEAQQAIYGFLSARGAAIGALAVATILIYFLVRNWSRISPRNRMGIFFSGAALLMVLPVSHLFFYYIQYSENDRYTYLALAMFGPAMALFFYHTGTWVKKLPFIAYLVLCMVFTTRMISTWKNAAQQYSHIASTYPVVEDRQTLILNLPDNYKGAYMFRNIGAESALEEVLRLQYGKTTGPITEVMQYNMTAPSDGVSASYIDGNTIRVEFNQWGNWWWRNGIGAGVRDNERFYATPAGKHYDLVVRDMPPDLRIVYYDGESWQVLEN